MDKISVVIITLNEAENIDRCINSVKSIADEIIVLDSFSTDETENICRANGVKFFQHQFDGYREQKNLAITYTSNDFVLSLDADEALDTELCTSIMLAKQHFEYDAYTMNRITNYCGKWIRHGSWYPDRKLRLFNKMKGEESGANPHEKIVMDNGTTQSHLKGKILHFSYNSIEGHITQLNKFTTISAFEMFREGRKVSHVGIFLHPLHSFIKGFFLRLGFLDGYYGILICIFNSFASYVKYAKLRQINKGLKV
jgi:glycosyltransferase involved in cell wall biosynthesis